MRQLDTASVMLAARQWVSLHDPGITMIGSQSLTNNEVRERIKENYPGGWNAFIVDWQAGD